MERQKPTKSSQNRQASRGRESVSTNDAQRLPQEIVCDPWPVTKLGGRKDSVLEAAQLLVQARNTELVNVCSKIILLPASGNVHGVQGGSRERSLYSFHAPNLEPFKVHMWQIPAVHTWNRTTWSRTVTPGKIMVRRGQKSEPLVQLLKTHGVAKREAKMSDLCNHFRCWRSLNTTVDWLNDFPKHLHGALYQIWWSFNGFHFLQLPPELREIILTFAMGPLAIPFARRRPSNRYPQAVLPCMHLSRVNKQLNREVIATLLAHTKFHFYSIEQFLRFFKETDDVSGAIFRHIRGFRFLELDLSPDALLCLFGVSFCPRDTRYEQRLALDPSIFINNELPLCQKIRIEIPSVFQNYRRPDNTCCQKVYNLAFWAGARARLRNIAVVELVGHIDATQKEEWLAEHALERKGIIPEAKDFAGWQRGIWTQW